MKRVRKFAVRLISMVVVFQLVFTAMGPFGGVVFAACTGSSSSRPYYGDGIYAHPGNIFHRSAQVGGISLDQAATFLEDMSDVTGAYFDDATNRIVLVGKKNTGTPVFDKDDLAVAIRSVIFNNTNPAVSIELTNPVSSNMNTVFYGQIENTNFGSVLLDADYILKQYFLGYNPSQQSISSSVSSYKSAVQRYLEQHPGASSGNSSRFWISPNQMVLKKDDSTSSFIFDQATMRVQQEPLSGGNEAEWNSAVSAWATDLTNNYNSYANEIPSWKRTRELGKLTSVVKWLKDNNIATDYAWAQKYTPEVVSTPATKPTLYSPTISQDGYNYNFLGGVIYDLANSYTSASGQASTLKSSAQSAATSPEASHWEFTQSSQDYVAIAVAADAFRSIGGYGTSVTDLSFDVQGDIDLAFRRKYTSLNAGQSGIGRGWDMVPARLTSAQPWNNISCSPSGGYSGLYPAKMVFQTLDGIYETFTYNCGTGYTADQPYYHTKLTRNTDGSYTVTLKNQQYYKFSIGGALLMHRDHNGNGLFYQYDTPGSNNITRISDIHDHDITLTYNSDNRISSVKDWTNRSVSFGYNSSGNLTTVTDPRSNVITYGYDSDNRLTSITDRLSQQVFSASYNDQDKMSSSTDSSGLEVDYVYDEEERIVEATDENSRVSEAHYDDRGRITELIDPLDNSIEYSYGTENSPELVTDKNGNETEYTYDSNGNTTLVKTPDDKEVEYTYNSKNQVTQISDERYGGTAKVTTLTYDTPGNLLTKTESGATETFTYNGNGLPATYADPLGNVASYTYNNFGTPTAVESPNSAQAAKTYDSLNRVSQRTDGNGKTESYTYDGNNNVLTVVNGAGTTTNAYNAENRLTSTTTPDSKTTQFGYANNGSQTSTTNALSNLTSYGYDEYANLTSRQDALNHTTEYEYDALNRRKESTTPLGKVKKWFYDDNGNITKRTDESNRDTTYTYNSMNRLTQITYPDSSTKTFTYNDRGAPTQITSPAGNTTFTYDNQDRLTGTTDPHSSSISYTYDNADNLTAITYPDSKSVNYKYDVANRLKSVSDWNSTKTYFNYNLNGYIQSKQLPNGIHADYAYDNANRLSSVTYTQDSALLTKFAYTRDARGNVLTETESKPATNTEFAIYEDGLASGWSNSWSWSSTTNLNNTSNVHAGTKSISWQGTSAWAGLHIRKTSGTISTSSYSAITFALKASQAGQKVVMYAKDGSDENLNDALDISMYGGHASNSGYKVYTIPLAALNAANTNISGFTIEDNTGSSQPALYIDSMKMTTASPSNITLYDESTAPEFEIWKWNGTENMADTTQAFKGSNSFSVTSSAGWSGIQFHHTGAGFSTKGSSALRFAIKGTQANQEYTVQMTDDTGTGFGAELDIAQYAGKVNASDYTVYTIPLADMSAQDVTTYGFILQNQNSSTQPKVLVDEVKIIPPITTSVTTATSTFTYDSTNRLLSGTYPYGTYTYTYDAAGNRATSNENGTSSTYTNNNDNQMTAKASRSFSYDNQGNMTADGSKTLTYDYDNRLKTHAVSGSPTITYVYDGAGNRIEKNNSGATNYHYVNDVSGDLSRVIVNKNATASTYTFYVYGAGLVSQGDSSASSRQYYLDDGLGNVRYTTNNTGGNVQSFTYDPYGNQLTGSGSNFAFQEQEKDSENGLMYLRARYYDPTTGHFTSRDPVEGLLAIPESQHGYSYANNNPVNYGDPSGEFTITFPFNYLTNIFAPGNVGQQYAEAETQRILNDLECGNYLSVGLTIAGYVPFNFYGKISMATKALTHVDDAHRIGGALSAGKSIFNAGENISSLVRGAESTAPILQSGGNYQRVVDAGRIIGTDRATGKATSIYTVITDKSNNLVTAFPGRP